MHLLKILCTPISEETEKSCTLSCTAFGCCTTKRTSPDCSVLSSKEALSHCPEDHCCHITSDYLQSCLFFYIV